MNWLDIIIIAVLIYSAVKGFYTGLIKSLTRLVSIAVGLFVAYKFYHPLLDYINSMWHWTDRIAVWVSSWIKTKYMPFYNGDIPVISELSKTLAVNFLELLAFVFLFFAVSRIIRLLGSFLSGLTSLILLKPLDRLGGTIFGLLKGVFIILVLLTIMTPLQVYLDVFLGGSKLANYFDQAWNNSSILPYYKELLKLFTGFIPGLSFSNNNYTQYLDVIKKYSSIK